MGAINSLAEVSDIAKQRVRLNYDFQMMVSGGTGEGKSTLLIWLMILTQGINVEEWIANPKLAFDFFMRHIIFRRSEAMDAIHNEGDIPQFSQLNFDESVNLLFKRDFMKGRQKELLKLLDMARKRNLVCGWAVPSFWSLDSHFMNSRVHMWLFVYERGKCHVYMPLKGKEFAYVQDPWMRRYNAGNYLGFRFTHSPNYKGSFDFPVLPKVVEDEYLKVCKLKGAGSEKDEDEEEDDGGGRNGGGVVKVRGGVVGGGKAFISVSDSSDSDGGEAAWD
jgi:hypothetical protein